MLKVMHLLVQSLQFSSLVSEFCQLFVGFVTDDHYLSVRHFRRFRSEIVAAGTDFCDGLSVQVSMSLMHLPSTTSLFSTASDFFCESRSASSSFSLDLLAFSTNPVDTWSLWELCLHLAQIGNRQGSSQKISNVESE